MEPTTLTVAAIATLVITKAFEKTGEILGEKALEKGGELLVLLRRKKPDTASAIEQAQQKPLDYGQAYLEATAKVEEAAKEDPEIAQAVENVADAVKSQPATVQNFGKLAEKIGMVIQGGTVNITNFNV
ncbi:hypothetical protein ACE1AT_07985 [Pelatocladus sp. BLCC-F211]|uniref:hypothetical protein n=1 Tax=Pelatocladus sp. BLCC-F211 TaxID=3342752 RepID=UPI0035BB3C3B